MLRHALPFLVVVGLGCKEDKPEPKPEPGKTAVAAASVDAAPSMAQAAVPDGGGRPGDAGAAAPTAAAGASVGVETCDEYLDKMARCIGKLSPESAQPIAAAMEDSRKAWRQQAQTLEGKAALVDACKAALDAGATSAKTLGCSW